MVPLPFPLLEAQEDFSPVFTVRTYSTPGGKFHNIIGAPLTGSPWSFNSHTCPHWASSNSSFTVQVFLPRHWFPQQFLLMSCHSYKLQISVFPCLSLQFWGQWFDLCPPLSYGCWFFSLCSAFYLFARVVISKHLTYRTGSWIYWFFFFQGYGFVAGGDSGGGKCLNIAESIITLRPIIHFILSNCRILNSFFGVWPIW